MTATDLIAVPGLEAPAEILVDPWGVPHIRAGSLRDLFFAQGFNAGRDRLWQIDLWRKRGLGLLARDFGPGYLAQDRASRLFLYRGPMEPEWAAYGPDARAICEAFVAGVNAWIAVCGREPARLAPEFAALGTRPEPWAPEDVVRIRSHGMTRNAVSEALRSHVLRRADRRTDDLRKVLEPEIRPEEEIDPEADPVPLAALRAYRLATAGATFPPGRLDAALDEAEAWSGVGDLGEVVFEAGLQGSNNWAVAPSRTATGRPILANDPHRSHGVPALRYLVHLTAPGLDAIGAGEPVIPGVSIGHNGRAAFGLTIFYADQEDLVLCEADPGRPGRYRFGGSWEEVRVVEEAVPVRGAPDQTAALRFTRHGPVLHEEPGRIVAIRSVWFEPGSAPYLRSLVSMRADDLPEFREAVRGWGVPSVNHVYADAGGTIAWLPAGFTPVRPGWSGLLPARGAGSHEWAGFLDMESLPRVVDPPEGFLATANEMNLPEGYPHAVGYEWIEGFRAARIREALAGSRAHAVEDSCRLQTDVTSIPARRLGRLLAGLAAPEGDAARALALLGSWDHALDAGSGPAALFGLWWTKHLKPALLALLAPDPEVRALLAPGDLEGLLRALERPDERFGEAPEARRDALLLGTLGDAFADAANRMGPDPGPWAWGLLHRAYFEHPLAAAAGLAPGLPEDWDIGPFPHGGDATTPMHTGYRPSDFRTVAGASVRIVVDVGDWDRSRWINAPGQSGDPRSPHYRDLAEVWAEGGTVPMLYSRAAVDAACRLRIVLEPVPCRE